MKRRSVVWSLLAGGAFAASVTAFRPAAEAAQDPLQDSMKMHAQMMSEMKKADTTLEALVADMRGAKGNAKIDAVAAVVIELVRQQQAMHARMGTMHDHTMGEMHKDMMDGGMKLR